MAINQPVNANTQVGVTNAGNEGYAKQEDLADALRPLILNGVFATGAGAPTAAPANGVPPFYVQTNTNPDTLWWWSATPAPGSWQKIGTPVGDIDIPSGTAVPSAAPTGLPLYIRNGATGSLWYYSASPAGWVELATVADVNALDPCLTVTPLASAAEVTAMAADPTDLVLMACHNDGSPLKRRVTGDMLAQILGGGAGGGGGLGDGLPVNQSLVDGVWVQNTRARSILVAAYLGVDSSENNPINLGGIFYVSAAGAPYSDEVGVLAFSSNSPVIQNGTFMVPAGGWYRVQRYLLGGMAIQLMIY